VTGQSNDGCSYQRPASPNSIDTIRRMLLWRTSVGDGKEIRTETALETQTLGFLRHLRSSDRPALLVPRQIYRVRIGPKGTHDVERFAFLEAYSEWDACSRVAAVVIGFDRRERANQIRARLSAESDEGLRIRGVSSDPEWRLFETTRSGRTVTGWVREPMFLLPTPSALTLLWARIAEGGAIAGHGPVN
jgi:hypothetical protein